VNQVAPTGDVIGVGLIGWFGIHFIPNEHLGFEYERQLFQPFSRRNRLSVIHVLCRRIFRRCVQHIRSNRQACEKRLCEELALIHRSFGNLTKVSKTNGES
jgi:hypothetical protein